jgi:hypothetical protein
MSPEAVSRQLLEISQQQSKSAAGVSLLVMGTLQGMELKNPSPADDDDDDSTNNSAWTLWLSKVAVGAVNLTRTMVVQTFQVSWIFCCHVWSSLVQPLVLLLPWSSSIADNNNNNNASTTTGATTGDQRRRHRRED